MDIRGRLARNVKRKREDLGWSQEDLADESGLRGALHVQDWQPYALSLPF